MTANRRSLFSRPDTLFGVCEGLGEETGLPPIVFRLGFALPLIFAPAIVLSIYFALGVVLAAMRRFLPPVAAARPAAPAIETPAQTATANDDAPLVLAA